MHHRHRSLSTPSSSFSTSLPHWKASDFTNERVQPDLVNRTEPGDHVNINQVIIAPTENGQSFRMINDFEAKSSLPKRIVDENDTVIMEFGEFCSNLYVHLSPELRSDYDELFRDFYGPSELNQMIDAINNLREAASKEPNSIRSTAMGVVDRLNSRIASHSSPFSIVEASPLLVKATKATFMMDFFGMKSPPSAFYVDTLAYLTKIYTVDFLGSQIVNWIRSRALPRGCGDALQTMMEAGLECVEEDVRHCILRAAALEGHEPVVRLICAFGKGRLDIQRSAYRLLEVSRFINWDLRTTDPEADRGSIRLGFFREALAMGAGKPEGGLAGERGGASGSIMGESEEEIERFERDIQAGRFVPVLGHCLVLLLEEFGQSGLLEYCLQSPRDPNQSWTFELCSCLEDVIELIVVHRMNYIGNPVIIHYVFSAIAAHSDLNHWTQVVMTFSLLRKEIYPYMRFHKFDVVDEIDAVLRKMHAKKIADLLCDDWYAAALVMSYAADMPVHRWTVPFFEMLFGRLLLEHSDLLYVKPEFHSELQKTLEWKAEQQGRRVLFPEALMARNLSAFTRIMREEDRWHREFKMFLGDRVCCKLELTMSPERCAGEIAVDSRETRGDNIRHRMRSSSHQIVIEREVKGNGCVKVITN